MANREQAGGTKVLVWQGIEPGSRKASPIHSRYITPEDNGVSRVYHFHPDQGHALEVDEADAAIILSGPDKHEFRIKAGGGAGDDE